MNIQDLLKKPLWQMTGEEFMFLLSHHQINNQQPRIKELIYGYAGIMKLMNCGRSKAQKMLLDGDFGDAVIQSNRKIIIDKEKALENLQKLNKKDLDNNTNINTKEEI